MSRIVIAIFFILYTVSSFGYITKEISYIGCELARNTIMHKIDSIISYELLSNSEIRKYNNKMNYCDVDVIVPLSEDTIIINPCNVNLSEIKSFQIYVRGKQFLLDKKYIVDCESRKYTFKSCIEDNFYPTNQTVTIRLGCLDIDESSTKVFVDDIIEFAEPPIWKFVYNEGRLQSKTTWTDSNIFHVDY